MTRPTVHDVAKTAGVSLATVDRVLNLRPGVRERTITRVHDAIDTLGYVRDVAAANLARQRSYTLVFVLPAGETAFLQALSTEIAAAAPRAAVERAQIRLLRVPPHDPYAFARALGGLGDVDGVALMAPETPQVRDAVRRLKLRGVPVVALVSDLPNTGRDHFAGINNVAAGRTAGVLMGRFLGGHLGHSGQVLVLAGSMLSRDHVDRRLGFDEVMRRDFPGLCVLPSVEGRDDAETIERILPSVLAAHPAIRGIYALGAGNRGLIRVLQAGHAVPRRAVIVHELSPHARTALETGTLDAVITQDVGHVIRSAIRVLRAKSDGVEIIASQERIRIDIVLRENLF